MIFGEESKSITADNSELVLIKNGKGNYYDKGYYYISEGEERSNIKYFDYSAKKEIYLCNRPNCNHDTEECNSYLDVASSCDLFIYNNNIYLITSNGETQSMSMSITDEGASTLETKTQTPIIYKMNLDGTNKTKLFVCPSGVEIGSNFIFDGKNLYTFFMKSKMVDTEKNSHTSVETERKLVKINLETQKYEEIFDSKNRNILRNI